MTMRSIQKCGALALAATVALTVAACGGGSSGSTNANGSTTLTWWHNGNAQPLLGIWQQTADAFHAQNPKVTLKVSPYQNEQFKTKIPIALQSNTPPDIYQQWGGGNEATQLASGKVADLTQATSSWISELGTAASRWQVNGKQYGLPYDLHMVGFWYRKDLFARAGIAAPPATMDQFTADISKLKTANITPVAIGSKDQWPDAFWWEYFAIRECSTATLQQAISSMDMNQPCFTKAGTDLTSFMKTNPFQTAFLSTPAQQGAGSSAGMVANGKAAMELQGDWDPGVMSALSTNSNLTSELGWFPFPTVAGGAGDPHTLLGGGDGFSCTTQAAEPACANFLKYIDSTPVQEKLVTQGQVGLPANPAAAAVLTNPTLKQIVTYSQSAPYIQTYFDIAFPTNPGLALDAAVANFVAGKGTPQAIIQSIHQ